MPADYADAEARRRTVLVAVNNRFDLRRAALRRAGIAFPSAAPRAHRRRFPRLLSDRRLRLEPDWPTT